MSEIVSFLQKLEGVVPFLVTSASLVFIYLVFSIFLGFVRRRLLALVKSKKQVSNVEIFSKVLKYSFLAVLVIFAVFSYAGSWTGLGIGIGLFTASIGWALQKPITGIAGWVLIITKRPFEIGDRIIMGSVKGDVADVTLSHIYLHEVGGTIQSEENSGRIIMIPNSQLFEQNIINYTSRDEFVLDQVVLTVTYGSNLDKAIKICVDAAEHYLKNVGHQSASKPYVRTYFQSSGMSIHVRYMAPAKRMQEVSSLITKEIFNRTRAARDVEIAYPHTKVILSRK